MNWAGKFSHFNFTVSFFLNTTVGFYIHSQFFPKPLYTNATPDSSSERLLLGPFSGKPACQYINVSPNKPPRGVCAAGFLNKETALVRDVEDYPGHIACDGGTKSELVVPLILNHDGQQIGLGVLDLDCLAVGGFDEDDRVGVERISELLVRSSHW